MITFERTTDLDLIRSIRTHPKIWAAFADDFTGPAETHYSPLTYDTVGHLLVKENADVLGLFIVIAYNRILWEVHACLLPKAWGAKALEIGTALREWCWRETGCMRLFAVVPAYNRASIVFARRVGFVQFGVNEGSIMKHGRLWGQVMLGMSRPKGGTT